MTAAIAAPSISSRIRLVTGETRRTPSVAPTMINATIATAGVDAEHQPGTVGVPQAQPHHHARRDDDRRRQQRPRAPALRVQPRPEAADRRRPSPATIMLCMKKCPCTTTAIAPMRQDQRTRGHETDQQPRRQLAALVQPRRGVRHRRDDRLPGRRFIARSRGWRRGRASSSLPTVSPGAGIGGSAIRATATVSLAAFVTTISPNAIAPAGTQYCQP